MKNYIISGQVDTYRVKVNLFAASPNSETPIIFSTLITIIIGWFTTISTNTVLFYGYINSEDQY